MKSAGYDGIGSEDFYNRLSRVKWQSISLFRLNKQEVQTIIGIPAVSVWNGYE
jgi:hypothetical protein